MSRSLPVDLEKGHLREKALKMRDLSATLVCCHKTYRKLKNQRLKEPYQMPPDEVNVAIELISNWQYSNETEESYKQIPISLGKYLSDLKNCDQVFRFIEKKMLLVDIRAVTSLATYAQCAAALYLTTNFSDKYWTKEDITRFAALEMILRSRADRAIGYWTCMMHHLQDSFKAQGISKSNSPQKPIQGALKIFLRENDRLLNKGNETIMKSFLKRNKSHDALNVVIDKIQYEIYCDGGYVYTTNVSKDIHLKRIKKDTLLKPDYIGSAKKAILSERR